MTRRIEPALAELDQELGRTRALLERMPEDKLGWTPHERSMTLGKLAMHVATIPDVMAKLAAADGLDIETSEFGVKNPDSKAEILQAFEEGAGRAREGLSSFDDADCEATWSLSKGGTTIFSVPRFAMLRSFLFNHLYHHRGQLTVYLRMLDVPLPATYGDSADEKPFG